MIGNHQDKYRHYRIRKSRTATDARVMRTIHVAISKTRLCLVH